MDMIGGGWMMIFWWALAIALIYLAVKGLTNQKNSQGDSPLEILKKRYAAGLISKKEFEETKSAL